MTFRILALVEDNRLAEVLRRLAGVTRDVDAVPIVEVPASGNVVTLFQRYLEEHGIVHVTHSIAKNFQASIGRSPGGANYILKTAAAQGILRKLPERGGYQVQKLLPDLRQAAKKSKAKMR
jgi:hypothetical protein